MEKEFIVETQSGSLYHVLYRHGLFEHGGRFSCRQLVGKTVDFGSDFSAVINFMPPNMAASGNPKLDIAHFKRGMCIIMGLFVIDKGKVVGAKVTKGTSPIVKIFERIS